MLTHLPGANMRKPLPWTLIGLCAAAALAFPVHVTCGAPGALCARPPMGPDSRATYYYEVEPLAVALLEATLQTNIQVYYRSGIEPG